MSYKLSEAAKQDMIATYLQGVRQFGIMQADDYHRILEATYELLAEHPKVGAPRSDIDPPVRIHPCGSHVIIYTIDDEGLFVLRLRHHRENWMEQLVN